MGFPRRLARFSFAHLIVLTIGLACLTSWATFTGYTAKQSSRGRDKTDNSSGTKANSVAAARLNKTYGNLPLSFEVNRGQTGSGVNYVAHGPGYNIFLTPGEAVLALQPQPRNQRVATDESDDARIGPDGHQNSGERARETENLATAKTPTIVKMRFDGASTASKVDGVEALPGKVNYLFGSDSSKWLTNIPTYSKVAYRNAYPGVDVVYYGTRRQLEYDLVVAPGTDPRVVSLKYEGVNDSHVDREGNLLLKTDAGELKQQKPIVYQEDSGGRKLIDAGYFMRGNGKVGFRVSSYDRKRPLIIDPTLSYSSLVNSSGNGYSIAVDANGSAYITGSVVIDVQQGNFELPPTGGAYQTISGGGSDVFVTKLDEEGNGAVYSTFLGGNGDDSGFGIAVDSAGNAYVTGRASGNFPTTAGAIQPTRNSATDAFIAKLNPGGSALLYSTFLGGNDYDDGDSIAVDGSGNAYVLGQTFSTNLATTPGAVRANSGGGSDSFIAKLTSTGALGYLTYLGGGGGDLGLSIAVDGSGNAYATGQTSSLDFPQVNGLQAAGGLDRGFFRSTDAGGSYVLRRTGMNESFVYAIAVDPATPTTMYAGTGGGVYKSTDGSNTWTQVPVGVGPRSSIRALLINSSAPATIYAGGGSGIFKSTNSGNSWTEINNGLAFAGSGGVLTPPNVNGLASLASAPNTVYAACNGGVFKTTDGGANWSLMNSGLGGTNVNTVVIDPTNPQTVYAGTLQSVSKSTNGGANWTVINNGLTTANSRIINTLAIDPTNPATIYAATQAGVYKTTNSGTSWVVMNNGLLQPNSDGSFRSNPAIRTLVINPSATGTIYAGVRGVFLFNGVVSLTTVFKSTDGGANWTAIRNGFGNFSTVWSLALDPLNANTVYAGTLGDTDAFVAKINDSGTALTYSTYLGGGRVDYGYGIAVDSSGSAYVSGFTQGSGFPLTAGVVQTVSKGDSDIFLTKFNPNGSSRIYSTLLGGTSHEDNYGVAVDASGNAYVAGATYSTDFPVTPGTFQSKLGGSPAAVTDDAFIAKVNPSATALVYSSYLGGSGFEPDGAVIPLNTIAIDPIGNAYLLGTTSDESTYPAFGYANGFSSGNSNATYVAKVDAATPSNSISGRLTTAGNAPIAGVYVGISNTQGFFREVASDSQGYYSLVSLPFGNYTVTPGKYGANGHYIFTPATQTFVGLNSDQTANFTGTQVFDIQGQITSSTVPGLGVFDVAVTLSGTANATTVTDANGNYSFQDLLTGNYTVTPSKTGFTFNPVNRTFNGLSADQSGADFTTASTTFFTVSGQVADAGNAGVANVLISVLVTPLRGSRALNVQTDVNGNYSIPNLQSGGNYSFLPSKPVLSFTPQNPTVNNLAGNQTINYVAAPVTGLIGKIAFGRSDNLGVNGISVMNADGTGEQAITTSNTFDEWPTWAPDGSRLAFTREDSGNTSSDIFVMNADGTGLTRITTAPLDDVIPSWSPDATQFTFTYGECSGSDTPPEVLVMDANGANRRKLTNNFVVDGFSDWSPGGSTIAFARGPSGDCSGAEEQANIYAIDPDGTNERVLANDAEGETRPVYSPDGSKIAYFRGGDNIGGALYVMNADGTGQTRISPFFEIEDTGKPTWSPDGKKIAFAATLLNGFISELFVINADGTGLAQITGANLNRFDPSWQHYSISGKVNGNTTGLPITMALAGTLTRVTQTDANGNYVFGNLAPGGNYSVSPISSAFGFNPAKTDISNLVGNQIANFSVLPAVIPAPTPTLADNFGGAQRDPTKWNLGTQTQPLGAFDPQVPVVQQNGQLIITPRSQTDGLHYNGYVSVNSFDFNNATATVEVAQTASNGADTIFAIGSDLENFARFVVRGGGGAPGAPKKGVEKLDVAQLIFQVKAGGQLTSVSIPYDPVQHRFMRFRHQPPNNSIAFETSPNNVDFLVQKEIPLEKGVSALTTELSAGTTSATDPGQAVFDNFQLVTNTVQFSAPSASVNEGQGSALLTVTRSGSTSSPAAVEYLSFDDSAHQSSKFILATGSIAFAPGETTKSIRVLIIDNALVDGNQTFYLNLTDSSGAGLNSPGRTALTILDNDTTPPTSNPVDNPDALFYVREHYYDFLNREPDAPGLAYWADQITSCKTDAACIDVRRVNVSAAFFLSIEFQETGYLVYRFYNAALDRTNGLPRYVEFIRDTQTIGRGVVVGTPGWDTQLESNKAAYADKFAARAEFTALYPSTLTPTQYVDALYAHAKILPSAAERQAAIDEFNNPTGARGRALRRVVENRTLYAREFNRAFVLAQYFGYLRRNPNDLPDTNYDGFNFWLGKLNQYGNYTDAEMVKAFISSIEYRTRFGP